MVFNLLKKLPFPNERQSIEQFVTEINELNKYTPDLSILEMFSDLLLFVPDEMRRGYPKYDLIKDEANYKATAFTDDPMFFFLKDLGASEHTIPVPLRHLPTGFIPFPPEPAKIKGELFRVNPELFMKLDEYKLNGVQFERKRVQILVPSRLLVYSTKKPVPVLSDVRIKAISAYMYVGVQKYWDNLLGGVFPAKSARLMEVQDKWVDKYYFYAKGNEL